MRRRVTIGGLVVLLLYVGSYIPRSMAGGYERQLKGYVGMRYWRPAGLKVAPVAGTGPSYDALGYAYWPLLKIDWSFVHRPYFTC